MKKRRLRIVDRDQTDFTSLNDQLAAPIKAPHPRLSTFGREYYPLVLGDQYVDCSFVVCDVDQPLASVMCGTNGQSFTQFGAPIKIYLAPGLSGNAERQVIREAIQHLKISASTEKSVELADQIGSCLTPLGEVCLAMHAETKMQILAIVDLTQEQQEIHAAIRKSYRSLINWGRANILLDYVNADHANREKFCDYQAFHKLIAGRVTRNQESWNAMYKAIESGGGELILGYQSGVLVSGTLIIDGAEVSIYASGVYDRSKFDHPLAHWVLYNAILRAKERGMRILELGAVDQASNLSHKEKQIALFKRGFASHLAPTLSWAVPIGD